MFVFLMCDMDFRILDCNDHFREFFGLKKGQIQGMNVGELGPFDVEFEDFKETVLRYRTTDKYQFEFQVANADGESVPVLFSSYITRDRDGKAESVNVMMTDISEIKKAQKQLELYFQTALSNEKKLEEEKKMIEAILFGIGDCVTIFDRKGNLILTNPKGIEIRGNRKFPLLSLVPDNERNITLKKGVEERQYNGKIEAICDENGEIINYVEILKDITPITLLKLREDELNRIKREIKQTPLDTKIIGTSSAMQKVFDLIHQCSKVDFDINIIGETGVGKELVARAIQKNSDRRDKPFVAVNCGALPEALMESELFGNIKGAFTGATTDRPGLFREAHQGVIFLDEIGDISLSLQVKLLRVLEEREVRPVGSSKTYPVDVRVIAATNKNLKKLTESGLFREDLFYRISVIPVQIPPLRDREEDISLLAEHFLKKHQTDKDQKCKTLDQHARQVLFGHSWPGNVRELENAIKYSIAMSRRSTIVTEDLPPQLWQKESSTQPGLTVESAEPAMQERINHLPNQPGKQILKDLVSTYHENEKASIKNALERNKGRCQLVAEELVISRTTLWRKMKAYQLERCPKNRKTD